MFFFAYIFFLVAFSILLLYHKNPENYISSIMKFITIIAFFLVVPDFLFSIGIFVDLLYYYLLVLCICVYLSFFCYINYRLSVIYYLPTYLFFGIYLVIMTSFRYSSAYINLIIDYPLSLYNGYNILYEKYIENLQMAISFLTDIDFLTINILLIKVPLIVIIIFAIYIYISSLISKSKLSIFLIIILLFLVISELSGISIYTFILSNDFIKIFSFLTILELMISFKQRNYERISETMIIYFIILFFSTHYYNVLFLLFSSISFKYRKNFLKIIYLIPVFLSFDWGYSFVHVNNILVVLFSIIAIKKYYNISYKIIFYSIFIFLNPISYNILINTYLISVFFQQVIKILAYVVILELLFSCWYKYKTILLFLIIYLIMSIPIYDFLMRCNDLITRKNNVYFNTELEKYAYESVKNDIYEYNEIKIIHKSFGNILEESSDYIDKDLIIGEDDNYFLIYNE